MAAKIPHDRLFDFEGYKKGINEVAASTKDLGKTIDDVIRRADKNAADLKQQFSSLRDTLKNFNVAAPGAGAGLDALSTKSSGLEKQLSDIKALQQGFAQLRDVQSASVQELRAEYSGLKKQYEALKPSQKDYAEQVANIKTRIQQVTPAITAYNIAIKAQKATIDAAEGSYKHMSQQLAEWKAKLQALPNAFDTVTGNLNKNNKEAVQYAETIQKLDATLKKADSQMGVYARNVGNYKSGFSGLNNAINQLTREAPAFAVSIQTGFLALSNNLPILADAVNEVQRTNKELVAAGEKPKSVFKQLASSIFSFQTLLSVGITLLVVYGKEIGNWLSNVFAGKDAIDKLKESQSKLNEAMADSSYKEAVITIQTLTNNVQLAKEGFISKEGVVKQYNESLGDTIGRVNSLDEVEQSLTKNGPAYVQMILYKAAAQKAAAEAADLMVEAAIKQAQDLQRISRIKTDDAEGIGTFIKKGEENIAKASQEAAQKRIKTISDITADFNRQAAEIAKQFKFDFFGGKDDTSSERVKRIRDEEEVLKKKLELNVIALKTQAIQGEITEKEYHEKTIQLTEQYVKKASALELSLGKDTDQKRLLDFKEYLANALQAQAEYDAEIEKRRKEREDRVRRSRPQLVDPNEGKPPGIADGLVKGFKEAAKATDDYYQGVIQNEDRLFAVLASSNRVSFRDRIDHLEKMKKLHEDAANAIGIKDLDLRKKYADAAKQYEVEIQAEKFAQITEGAQEALSLLAGVYSAFAEMANNESQAKIESLEHERDAQIEAAGSNAAAREAIEKRFNERILIEKRKQAQRDKIAALFQAGINAGDAILKTLATFGPPFPPNYLGIGAMALTGATIAAQIAAIASKPLPKFKKGTRNAPQGYAIVNEEGAEIIQDRRGSMRVAEGSLTYLNGGEKIFTHNESKRIVNEMIRQEEVNKIIQVGSLQGSMASEINRNQRQSRINELAIAMRSGGISKADMQQIMKSAMKDIVIEKNNWDERGYHKSIETINERRRYLNAR